MTIRGNVNIRMMNASLDYLDTVCLKVPDGHLEEAKSFRETVSAMMDSIEGIARSMGLRTDPCDHSREVEALLCDMLLRANPQIGNAITRAFSVGEELETYPERESEIIAALGGEPHAALTVVRPDEVAECWNGISPPLYQKLWECVANYTGPTPAESEEPVYGLNSVASFWHHFDEQDRLELNAAADRMDKEMSA